MLRLYCIFLYCSIHCALHSQRISILLNTSASYRMVSVPKDASASYASYLKNKRNGTVFNAEVVWYAEGQGIGIRANAFFNHLKGSDIRLSDYDLHAAMAENIRIVHYGLQYHKRKHMGSLKLYSEIVAGLNYVTYTNNSKLYDEKIVEKAATYGLNGCITVEYMILSNVSIYANAEVFMANIGELDKNGSTAVLKEKESLTHGDGGLGLKIHF